ncbi:MAG: PaaI family thioesterase [Butyricicoccus sp.]
MSDQAMEYLRSRLHKCEYHRLCGLNIISFGKGFAEVIMEPHKEILNPMGAVHGGAIFTLCDLAAGAAAASYGQASVTQCANISFLRPGKGTQRLTAKTRELKKGRSTGIYEVTVTDEDDEMVARATMTMFFVGELEDKLVD